MGWDSPLGEDGLPGDDCFVEKCTGDGTSLGTEGKMGASGEASFRKGHLKLEECLGRGIEARRTQERQRLIGRQSMTLRVEVSILRPQVESEEKKRRGIWLKSRLEPK